MRSAAFPTYRRWPAPAAESPLNRAVIGWLDIAPHSLTPQSLAYDANNRQTRPVAGFSTILLRDRTGAPNGRVLTQTTQSYTYDNVNRLASVTKTAAATNYPPTAGLLSGTVTLLSARYRRAHAATPSPAKKG